ncbi:MAG: ATP-dependent DNA ligase [Gemmatimonadetes bacterium]|nr:ATP-dependent DNA ligase [Gemmatimonadota bacterium]
MDLPIRPPFPPMEAKSVEKLPSGAGWLFEPKWDGFRCLSFRNAGDVLLQSKSAQPLARYFPELVEALRGVRAGRFVLDGEIVIAIEGALAFDDLLQRIHPAESRIRRLAAETPATLLVFDLLVDARGKSLIDRPLIERRQRLESLFREGAELGGAAGLQLSPATQDREVAEEWMRGLSATGLDGVMAKELAAPYRSGDRSAMNKVKRMRTADCVVGGFRYAQRGGEIGSLLLGLYNDRGLLDHVGFTSSFRADERCALKRLVTPLVRPPGFTGKAPGGPSRWSSERSGEWEPLEPRLVCEVRYDHFSGDRFRHGTKLLRWRPDKAAEACTMDQVRPLRSPAALARLGLGAAAGTTAK